MKTSISPAVSTPATASPTEVDLATVAAAGGVDRESFGYQLGYVIGGLEAMAVDAIEWVTGHNIKGA